MAIEQKSGKSKVSCGPRLAVLGESALVKSTGAFAAETVFSDFEIPRGELAVTAKRVSDEVRRLVKDEGAVRVVFGAFELHELAPRFTREVREQVISLPELALWEARKAGRKALVLCESSSRKAFGASPSFEAVAERILFLSDVDQSQLRTVFEKLRRGGLDPRQAFNELVRLAHGNYDTEVWIGASAEVHAIAAALKRSGVQPLRGAEIVDPLGLVAQAAPGELESLPTLDSASVPQKKVA